MCYKHVDNLESEGLRWWYTNVSGAGIEKLATE